tara:strand:- start:6909 stop:7568 length:660 start_codon:yes stop_codon:yes gene_type:complete
MRVVGFGCSFTYGSELVDPEIGNEHNKLNDPYREKHVWLGRLADSLGCGFDNRGEPANSNFAIAQQVSQYFLKNYNESEKIIICIGWTAKTRMSWYGSSWIHNGFVNSQTGWTKSAKEWTVNSTTESFDMYTDNAKLIVNSICKAKNIPILQFNSLGNHETTNYPNYFIDGSTMRDMLEQAVREDNRKNFMKSGGHPNEQGHEYFTIRLTEFAKSHIID